MRSQTPSSIAAFASAAGPEIKPVAQNNRPISIWEITSWILPMAPEHLRRVLASSPHLPQGQAGAEGSTRWFAQSDIAALRAHFAQGPRKSRYQPPRPTHTPIITLTGPAGAMGRSTSLLHLAVGAALSGYRILVIEGDPSSSLAECLPEPSDHGDGLAGAQTDGSGVLSLIARSAAEHLRRLNEARLDRGDSPQPMDAVLTAALTKTVADLIRPSRWPGLDVMPLGPALVADVQIAQWRHALRNWQPGRALAIGLDALRPDYDLILCDTPRGLGALALSLLTAADVLLAPLPLQEGGLARLTTGLQGLAQAAAQTEAEVQSMARAVGQTAPPQTWQQLLILPNRAGPDAARQMAGFATKLGDALLPTPLPEIEAVATSKVAQFYDLDYRRIGRLPYAPLRDACDAAWRGLALALPGFAAKP